MNSVDRVREQVRVWRDELLSLSRRDRVLYYRPTASASLLVERPGLGEVLRVLTAPKGGWDFYYPPRVEDLDLGDVVGTADEHQLPDPFEMRAPSPTELVTQKRDPRKVEGALRALDRRSTQEFVDKGIWVLYLAAGFLEWVDPKTEDQVRSPLLLVPVSLVRPNPRVPFRLTLADEDAVVNPALSVKMEVEFGVKLPVLEDPDDIDINDFLGQVANAVKIRPWSVNHDVAIDVFSSFKSAMYRDLKDNEDAICESPLIQALAGGGGSDVGRDFSPPAESDLDSMYPPEEMATILDADGTQRRCIVAASQGKSFVMDGPPGTGKSQTIANIVSQAIHDGRTVLFVSEKIAALEVVKARLDAAGLGEYLLELHSHKAGRKEVAQALAASLNTHPRPTGQMDLVSRERLRSIREELSGYAAAMNETRPPLGKTLHSAIGQVSKLHAAPRVTVPSSIDSSLDVATFQRILSAAESLGRAWSPVARLDDFVWRGVKPEFGSPGAKRDVDERLSSAVESLDRLETQAGVVARELELWWDDSPQSASALLRVVDRLTERRPIPGSWLTSQSLGPIKDRLSGLRQITEEREEVAIRLRQLAGSAWERLDPLVSERVTRALGGLVDAQTPWATEHAFTTSDLQAVAELFERAESHLLKIEELARQVADSLGVEAGELTPVRVGQLASLGDLIGSPNQPEEGWLDPLALVWLGDASSVLGALVREYRAKAESLATIFTPSVLELDLETLHARFATLHRGVRKLGAAYRADKKLLAGATRVGKVSDAVIDALPSAIEWQRLNQELSHAEKRHSDVIGDHYYQGPASDFEAITNAISVARSAVELAGRQIADAARFRAQLSRGGQPDPEVKLAAADLRAMTRQFLDDARAILPSAAPSFDGREIAEVRASFLKALPHVTLLTAELKEAQSALGRDLNLAGLVELARDRTVVFKHDLSLEATLATDQAALGEGYVGVGTDWGTLDAAVGWAESLRNELAGGIEEETARRLLSTELKAEALAHAEKAWHQARDRVAACFEDSRAASAVSDLEAGFSDATELLTNMRAELPQIDEWLAFSEARNRLAELGVAQPTEDLIQMGAGSGEVLPAIERAVFEAWIDAILESDDRLRSFRSEDRDAFVRDFRHLDHELIKSAAGKVMQAANARRPQTTVGAAGTIQREGMKQRRHMPVRTLLSQTAEIAQALKPCFMMSPLSVSQFVSPEMRFDLVIFDEASQVRPSDAVNCVYRGRQVVIAGDQKQLPPTSFFEAMLLDEGDEYEEDQFDEFESVLDLAKAGGMESLPLRWHYRSQHESLITYSNYSFYEGRLVTFPGSLAEAPDVGLETFYVDGKYRRGGNRDNIIEAEKVAERVLHHATHHAHLTLGVVAFSEAQASTIQYVLERRRRDRPELDGFFDVDRLTGFFVKNLESVQGDERDIIIFSVGYGPDEVGKITMNFGPLNRKGGQRRLNVAITRARRRVEVVSSLHPSQFAPTNSDGPRHLGRYLDFIDRGIDALALEIDEHSRGAESPFEEEVARVLSSWGYDTHLQVGVAEYRIDIAIADPSEPGSFLLGIECDGAMYHSSQVARDRDRLRQEVLERLGWKIHRIWGPAWYRNRAGEEDRLRQAIEAGTASEKAPVRRPSRPPRSEEPQLVEIDLGATPVWAVEYIVSRPSVANYYEMGDPTAVPAIARAVEEVVRTESPVHKEVVLRRIRTAWGVGRAGSRVRESFEKAVWRAGKNETVRSDRRNFLWDPAQDGLTVRTPGSDPDSARKVSEVAPEELELAILNQARDARRSTWDDLATAVARLLGWTRRGAEIDGALEAALKRLIKSGQLVRDAHHLIPPPDRQ